MMLEGGSSGSGSRSGGSMMLVGSDVSERSVAGLLDHFQTQVRLQSARNAHRSLLQR